MSLSFSVVPCQYLWIYDGFLDSQWIFWTRGGFFWIHDGFAGLMMDFRIQDGVLDLRCFLRMSMKYPPVICQEYILCLCWPLRSQPRLNLLSTPHPRAARHPATHGMPTHDVKCMYERHAASVDVRAEVQRFNSGRQDAVMGAPHLAQPY